MRVRHCDVLFPTGNQCSGNNSETRPCTPDSNFIPGEGPHTLSPYTDKCMRQVLTLILTEVLIDLHKLTHNQYRRMLNPLCSVYKQVQEHTHTLFPWHKYSHTHCLSKVWGSQAWANTLALHHHMLAALTHFQESSDNEICYWASKGHLPGQRSGSLSGQHF